MLRLMSMVRYGALGRLRNGCFLVFLLGASVAQAADRTIIAFGDSLTQGFGLPAAQGFVPQLEHWLTGQGLTVRVINAGVSGDTTAGGKSRIDWTLSEPADAILIGLGGNDVLRGLPPAVARNNMDYILNAATQKGLQVLLIGMQAPLNYGADYKTSFDAIYPDLAAKYDVALYPSFFAAFAGQGDVPAQLGENIQADGLHPSAIGVQRIVAHMGPAVLDVLAD
ncbi:MAG: arylesterase [Pseudomonadota bacterium]